MSESGVLLEKAIRSEYGEGSPYAWEELPSTGSKFTLDIDGPIEVEVVERESGFDNADTDEQYPATETRIVLRVGDTYFLKEGRYESFVGSDWTRPLREVKPTTKTITVFE